MNCVKDTNTVRFAEKVGSGKSVGQRPWKILIADDEDEIHVVTRLVFDGFLFEEQPLEFLSAYSGAESKALLRKYPDIALVLLDVVMEEETSGLEVARFVREDLHYKFVRIVLRTGQPGQAPEHEVTVAYDINDYKDKTELTVPKLFTTVLGSLRAYRDLRAIEQSRQGLEQIVTASTTLFEHQSIEKFAAATLAQLGRLLQPETPSTDVQSSGFVATLEHDRLHLLANTDYLAESSPTYFSQKDLPEHVCRLIQQVRQEEQCIFQEQIYVDYFHSRYGLENIIFFQNPSPLNDIEQDLLRIFSGNIAVAFDNIYLNQAIVSTQKEVIFTLGQVIDTRSKETDHHVKRIAALAYALALDLGLSEQEADLLRLASPMHDIGKIGIPDAILDKHSPLTDEEDATYKTHPQIGYAILKDSKQEILKTAATIALQHHEHWDGSGYPQGLRGEQIHLFARIIKLVDVFDTLTHPGHDEDIWPLERIIQTLQHEREKQFDPAVTDTFLKHIEKFLTIQKDSLESPS